MKILGWLFGISFLILATSLVVAYVKLADQSALLVLHFDEYRGIDFLGSTSDVFGILGLGLGIALINALLARIILPKDQVISWLFAGATALLSFLLFITTLVIIANN